jgi:hypothetical protein
MIVVEAEPRIYIFAARAIAAFTPLTYDYGDFSEAAILARPWLANT